MAAELNQRPFFFQILNVEKKHPVWFRWYCSFYNNSIVSEEEPIL